MLFCFCENSAKKNWASCRGHSVELPVFNGHWRGALPLRGRRRVLCKKYRLSVCFVKQTRAIGSQNWLVSVYGQPETSRFDTCAKCEMDVFCSFFLPSFQWCIWFCDTSARKATYTIGKIAKKATKYIYSYLLGMTDKCSRSDPYMDLLISKFAQSPKPK